MEDYVFKIVVEIDEDKVNEIGETDLDTVYGIVRTTYVNHGLHDVSEGGRQLIFISKDGEDYAYVEIGMATFELYDSWLRKYLKKMDWYDSNDDSIEDMLIGIRQVDMKCGR